MPAPQQRQPSTSGQQATNCCCCCGCVAMLGCMYLLCTAGFAINAGVAFERQLAQMFGPLLALESIIQFSPDYQQVNATFNATARKLLDQVRCEKHLDRHPACVLDPAPSAFAMLVKLLQPWPCSFSLGLLAPPALCVSSHGLLAGGCSHCHHYHCRLFAGCLCSCWPGLLLIALFICVLARVVVFAADANQWCSHHLDCCTSRSAAQFLPV